jgi:uncharacterized membrane protein YccC
MELTVQPKRFCNTNSRLLAGTILEGGIGMLKKRRSRRVLATFLVVLGGVLIFLAPEMWVGLVLLVMGALVELAGIAMEHRA